MLVSRHFLPIVFCLPVKIFSPLVLHLIFYKLDRATPELGLHLQGVYPVPTLSTACPDPVSYLFAAFFFWLPEGGVVPNCDVSSYDVTSSGVAVGPADAVSSSQDMKIVYDGTAACLKVNLIGLNDTRMIITICVMHTCTVSGSQDM